MASDEKWMSRALALAAKGQGFVHPNPLVGAVLVRDGRVVGEGFHRRFGEPHAEVEAIRRAGSLAKGSTLYVNLEPCAHWGKTPPCADAVIRSGITRVVAAMKDPNSLVSGKGFAALKRHGVALTIGLLKTEATHLNRAFVTWVVENRPYVTLKVASSLDGRTATITGESKWITGEKARRSGYALRAQVDAIAVGAGTVLKDNPSLTAHGFGRNPIRVVFAGRRRLPPRSKLFNNAAPTWVIKAKGKSELRQALTGLARKGVAHLLVEGGLQLQKSFLDAGLVDEVLWHIAPLIIGDVKNLRDASSLKNVSVNNVGKDVCVTGYLASPRPSPYGRGRP